MNAIGKLDAISTQLRATINSGLTRRRLAVYIMDYDAVAESRSPVSRTGRDGVIVQLRQDGTAEPVSRDQILRRERGQGKKHFSCSPDHQQDRQPYPLDP